MVNKENSKSDVPSWWVWVSWLSKEDGDRHFLYGCCAPIRRSPGWKKPVCSVSLPGGGHMEYQQEIVSSDQINSVLSGLESGHLQPDLVFDVSPSVEIKNKRTFLSDDLGHKRIRTDVHHSLPSLDEVFGAGRDQAIKVVLENLKFELNANFDGPHAGRLGAFEVKHLHSWLNEPAPVLVDLVRHDETERGQTDRSVFQASRAPAYSHSEHRVHLVCKSGQELIGDQLITLAAGEERSADIVLSESADAYEYWWFDEAGRVIAHEDANFISKFGLNMQVGGRVIEIKDKLSERVSQTDKSLGGKISEVQAHSTTRSNIDWRGHKEVRQFEQDMKNLTGQLFPKPYQDMFFEKGVRNEIKVIEHFVGLVDAARVKKAILVDPFFSPEALLRLIARIKSTDMQLTIISSLAKVDADTGEVIKPTEDPQRLLMQALQSVRGIVNPRVRVLNLQHKNDQAFHDRYLLLYPHEGLPEVYLLSNSINKMSGNWPFCMSLLVADVAIKVQEYIEGLECGEDVSGCTSPEVSFEWPANDA